MKQLTLIIHTDAQQDLADKLRTLKQVTGFTFSHVEGHGTSVESDAYLLARDKVVGHTPRIRAEILLQDADVDGVLVSLRASSERIKEHGIYWVSDVEEHGKL